MKTQCSIGISAFRAYAIIGFACVILSFICSALMMGSDARSGEPKIKPSLEIQEVNSPSGITAWLVEKHNLPFFTLMSSFRGGGAQDPQAK